MRRNKDFWFWAVLILIVPRLALSQEAGRLLSWDDCVSIAAKNNPDLSASKRAQEAGLASYKGSFNGLLPQVSLSNSMSESNSRSKSWQVQAGVSLGILNASDIASIRSAKASLAQAQANLWQSGANVRFNLRQAFLQLLFAQENLETSRRIKDMRAKSARLVTLRYDSGRESKGNMLRAQAQASQAQSDYEIAALDLRTAQKALDRHLGLDDFRPVLATGTLSARSLPEPPTETSSFLSRRPDIAVQEATLKSVMASLQQAKSSLWPSLSATYTRSRSGSSEFPSAQYSWSAGGALSYPLFGGGPTAVYYGVAAANRNLERAREGLRAVRAQAIVDLDSVWTDFAKASAQVKVQAALLAAARQRNIEADVRYDSGLLTYDNWEIISSDRISQERQSLSAYLNAANAEASWDRALGKGLGE